MGSLNSRRTRLFRFASAGLAIVALAYFSWLMLRITRQYIPIDYDVAFLRIKQQYIGVAHWKLAFFIHVFTSMFALLAGFTQFSRNILRRARSLHRWMGRAYVLNVVLITGPASLVMAFYANGGATSRIAFALLAIAWIGSTYLAYRTVRGGDVARHREWMIRSYALTLSAITLRVWKYFIVVAFAPPPMDVYRIVAWLGWIPNLLIAEWIIHRSRPAVARSAASQNQSLQVVSLD